MSVGLNHYLVLSAVLFCIGLYGALSRRNAIVIMMCIEIMLNSVNIALVAFSRYIVPNALTGQIFAIFVIVVAAAEAAVGLAIVISIYRNRETVDVSQIDLLKW
ncbi:MAG: NADH-quinone oxidoreductase subunit NuoK [Chloroflexi bacterium]|nr:NADH-quinone oxidoreductase subunit NuoK [Chloroflexota bacterium]